MKRRDEKSRIYRRDLENALTPNHRQPYEQLFVTLSFEVKPGDVHNKFFSNYKVEEVVCFKSWRLTADCGAVAHDSSGLFLSHVACHVSTSTVKKFRRLGF